MQTMSRFNVWVTFFRPTHTPNVRRYLRYVLFSRQSNPIPNPNPSVARSPECITLHPSMHDHPCSGISPCSRSYLGSLGSRISTRRVRSGASRCCYTPQSSAKRCPLVGYVIAPSKRYPGWGFEGPDLT